MSTVWQIALPLAVMLLVAGGSLVLWVILFRVAAHDEDAQGPGSHPSPSGPGL